MIERAPIGNHIESNITWRYTGGGVWVGTKRAQHFFGGQQNDFTLRYTGTELLKEWRAPDLLVDHILRVVFVPADDASAVEEHLSKR